MRVPGLRTQILCFALMIVVLPASSGGAPAISSGELFYELEGLEPAATGSAPLPNASDRHRAVALGLTSGLLLIPESTNDRVMAFDPVTGDLVDADFIPGDPTNLSTPIHAIAGFDGTTILVSDQLEDAVFEYNALTGAFLGLFAPAGGVDPAILDNIRGIALGSSLFVTVGGGTNADAVAAFDAGGVYQGNFVANGAGGLGSPFDVYFRPGPPVDALVSGINSDTIHSYDAAGNANPPFAAIDGFPQQIYEIPGSGNVLVGNFSGTEEGVVEYTGAGALVGIYDPAALGGYRGVFELGNGNILTTNGGGVHEIDRLGNLVETKISGVSARFIELVLLEAEIFADGFESGDTSAWSGSVP